MESKRTWRCAKCDKELVLKKMQFSYLGHSFSHEIMRCPKCGNGLIPRELAEGRMAEVEEQLEDK